MNLRGRRVERERTAVADGADSVVRRLWRIKGQVQGVGFRPYVYRIATELGLSGTVRNDPAGVTIDAWAAADDLDVFQQRLLDEAPPLARIDSCEFDGAGPVPGEPEPFHIIQSDHDPAERGRVTVDSAVCADCLAEMFDPDDRRYRHALVNCTNCGPRYTIVRDLPYDRPLTTMADFPMCPRCRAEYEDPGDRRFHAQPTCCPACGPQLALVSISGEPFGGGGGDPIRESAALLRSGRVLAMKGLGGYHLVVDARNDDAVALLRRRKKRDHKPLAIMARDVESVRRLVHLSDEAEQLLCSPVCPIVLAPRRDGNSLSDLVAPGSHRLGVMIPYTPMQHLLFYELGDAVLVMTSANLSDDPLVKDDDDAKRRLADICDALLLHDRPIERAVDDSIVLDASVGVIPLRRARGYVPAPLALPIASARPGLCVGGELKNAAAIVRGSDANVGQHIGDLGYTLAYARFERTLIDLQRLFDIEPEWIACDMHPAYLGRRYARRLAEARGMDLIEVQHHHAHMASLMAEHGRTDPIIALVCDGVGHGEDGSAWGGEVLCGDLTGYDRLGRLRPLRLPGGDAAAKQTGRCAASWLGDLLGDDAPSHALAAIVLPDEQQRDAVFEQLRADLNCPPSSGMGRLFDAAAALLGVCDFNHYEAMSGQVLEAVAEQAANQPDGSDLVVLRDDEPWEMDHRPLLEHLLDRIGRGDDARALAWLFHDALADGLVRAAQRAAEATGITTVGLTGGVFCNALLTRRVHDRLVRVGLDVMIHKDVPPNDGGICHGQAAIAAACLEGG